jgi:hypothetical protein
MKHKRPNTSRTQGCFKYEPTELGQTKNNQVFVNRISQNKSAAAKSNGEVMERKPFAFRQFKPAEKDTEKNVCTRNTTACVLAGKKYF